MSGNLPFYFGINVGLQPGVVVRCTIAILNLKPIADFAHPTGAQNPQSVAVQAPLR
jgi:hypothetical protein